MLNNFCNIVTFLIFLFKNKLNNIFYVDEVYVFCPFNTYSIGISNNSLIKTSVLFGREFCSGKYYTV